jgi:putative transposase
MSESDRNQKRDLWEERITQCRKTGLSVKDWCQLNQISRSVFYYWQRRINNLTSSKKVQTQTAVPGTFIEIPIEHTPEQSGIEIQCNDVTIRVEKSFDKEALAKVVAVLREVSC